MGVLSRLFFSGQSTSSSSSGSSWVGGMSESSGGGFGDGLGKSLLKLLADPASRGALNETLFGAPPQEIQNLRELLDIALKRPDELVLEDIEKVQKLIMTSLEKLNALYISSASADLSERPDLQKLGLTKKKLEVLVETALTFCQASTNIDNRSKQLSTFVHFLKNEGKANLRICARIVASLEKALHGFAHRTFNVLDQNITREPHNDLTNIKSLISQCKTHRQTIPLTLMTSLVLQIERLIDEQDSIFIEPFLSEHDESQLTSLWKYFDAVLTENKTNAIIPINRDVIEKIEALETLIERLCKEQSGMLVKIGHVVKGQIFGPSTAAHISQPAGNRTPLHLKRAKEALVAAQSALQGANDMAKKQLIADLIPPLEKLTNDPSAMSHIPAEEHVCFARLLTLLQWTVGDDALLVHIQDLLNPAAQSAIKAYHNAPSASQNPSQGSDTIGFFMKKGEEILQLLMSKTESVVSRSITRSLATVLNLIYSYLAEHFKSDVGNKTLKEEFGVCMQNVQNAQASGDFSSIVQSLKTCFAIFRKYDTYIQGIHLPIKLHSNSSPLTKLYELEKNHEESLAPPKETAPPNVQNTASRLKKRCAAFLTTYALSKVCGLVFEEARYSQFLSDVQNLQLATYSQDFKARFFSAIDETAVNWINRWTAKTLYPLVHACISFYINSAVNGIVSDFYQWKNRYNVLDRGNNIVKFATNYFSVLSAVQHSVAGTPPENRVAIEELFKQELERPNATRNGGLPPEKFYTAIIQAFTKYIRFQWIEAVENYFNQPLLPSSSKLAFLIPALDIFSFVTKILLKGLLYLPQYFANAALQKGTSFLLYLKSNEIYHEINHHIEHYSNPFASTSSHAVHKVIAAKLKQVTALIHERFYGVSVDGSPLRINLDQERAMQVAIGGCIHALLEFLKQNRYATVHSLKNYIDGNLTLEERAEREIDAFFLPKTLPSVALTLWTALQGFLTDDDHNLEHLFDTAISVSDSYFDPPNAVDTEDFNLTQTEITNSASELLHSMLFYLIGRLDSTNAKQQEELTHFITALKEQTGDFIRSITAQTERIEQRIVPEEQTKAARDTVSMSKDFIKARINALGKSADGNPSLQEETKKILNELIEEFNQKIEPLCAQIDGQLRVHQNVDQHNKIARTYNEANRAVDAIENCLCKPTLSQQDLTDAEQHFARLASHMEELNAHSQEQMRALNPFHRELMSSFERIKTLQQLPAAQERLKEIKGHMSYHFDGLEAYERQTALEERELAINGCQTLRDNLRTLAEWEGSLEDITLYNIVLIDHMEWVRKWIHSLAMWRVESLIEQIRNAFIKSYPYRCAIQLGGRDCLDALGLRV